MVGRLKSELRGRAGQAVRGSKGRRGGVEAQKGRRREVDGEEAYRQGAVPAGPTLQRRNP